MEVVTCRNGSGISLSSQNLNAPAVVGRDDVHSDLVALADNVRRHIGVALQVNSGVRLYR